VISKVGEEDKTSPLQHPSRVRDRHERVEGGNGGNFSVREKKGNLIHPARSTSKPKETRKSTDLLDTREDRAGRRRKKEVTTYSWLPLERIPTIRKFRRGGKERSAKKEKEESPTPSVLGVGRTWCRGSFRGAWTEAAIKSKSERISSSVSL